MKLIMIMCVRDEDDIIEDNLRFHFNYGIDEAIVLDNGSIDKTRDILSDLSKQFPIKIVDEPARDHSQGVWMTRLGAMARDDFKADWLLPNDADEFWWNGGASLKTLTKRNFYERPGVSNIMCPRFNMVAGYDASEERHWSQRLIYRPRTPVKAPKLKDFLKDPRKEPHFYALLRGKVMIRAKKLIEIREGSHRATVTGGREVTSREIGIYHFPIRTQRQFKSKTINGAETYAKNTSLAKRIGWHQKRWYWLLNNRGFDEAISDAIPSQARIEADILSGKLIEDKTIAEAIAKISRN